MKTLLLSTILLYSSLIGLAVPPAVVPLNGNWREVFSLSDDVSIKDRLLQANERVQGIFETEAEWEAYRTKRNARVSSEPPFAAKLHYAANKLAHFTFMADNLASLSAPASIPDLRTLITCAFANAVLQPRSLTHWQTICAADYTAAVSQGKLGQKFCWGEEPEPDVDVLIGLLESYDIGTYRWPVLWPVPIKENMGVAREASGKWECVVAGVLEHSGVFTALVSVSRFSEAPAFNGYLSDTSLEREYEFFNFPISFVEELGQLKLRDAGGPNPTQEQVKAIDTVHLHLGASLRSTLTEYSLGLIELLPALGEP